jgi:glycosyltransferase involved in cell wall biosynthesis
MIWSYLPTPLAVQLVRKLRPDRLVYHCIDDMARNLAGAASGLGGAEDWLVRHADHVFATSQELYSERKAKNSHTTYLPEAADIAPFMQLGPEPDDLIGLPHPRICFFGTLDLRIDQTLLIRVADAYPAASIVLIGPTRCDLGRLRRRHNIHFMGFRPHDALPAYLHHMNLFIIPYQITPYTVNVHPVKTYEALVTGKPLVTTDLPELRPYAPAVTVARDEGAFLAGIASGLTETDPGLAGQRREIARQNTWDARYRIIKEKLPELA